jgi:hypothetical protein
MSWDLLVRGSETQAYLSALEKQLEEDANNFVARFKMSARELIIRIPPLLQIHYKADNFPL